MRRVGRHRLQRLRHDFGDLLVTDLARSAAARLVIKAIEALFGKPLSSTRAIFRRRARISNSLRSLSPSMIFTAGPCAISTSESRRQGERITTQ
jgi:hypothetical protein